ncbi:TPA: hypothetical protein N0F65_001288 [Lagenidium giganteum]|uniref:Uncharacterized protein n=1 Tax=Lagenidium giganteum TaxID=4803 RepID=A0AAV2Z4Z7_9STRA|nr:TPA: hypothetical protein N0F65_001288 [Lagenidium giganteum]
MMEANNATKRSSKKREKRVRINMTLCKYEVVRKIVRERGWHMVTDEEDKAGISSCNVHWIDVPDFLGTFKMLLPYQKVNHFPGMTNLARKSKLARNFERMKKLFPDEYDFCPKTWILPFDLHEFQQNFNQDGMSQKTFIIKPDHNCQGRGVFLTRNLSQINKTDVLVAQQYIARPMLIDNRKFDLRIYVLVSSCNPLRVYLFRDGLVRMCTADYVTPNAENMEQRFMHLTNYAVNKHSNNFEVNKNAQQDGQGSKRSLRWFFEWLKESHDEERVDKLWEKIGDICLKAILAVQPTLAQEYKSTFAKYQRKSVSSAPAGGRTEDQDGLGGGASALPQRPSSAQHNTFSTSANTSSSCFSILGMDVLVDETLKPWLLEVNHLPSFGCDSPLDWNIKERLISQTLDIMNISADDKERWEMEQARSTQMRLYGAASVGSDNQAGETDTSKPETVDPSEQEAMNAKSFKSLAPDELREALTGYYRMFNAERLKDLDKIMAKYATAQEELNRSLMLKYGKSIADFAPNRGPEIVTPRRDEKPEQLIDYTLMYPPPPEEYATNKYRKMLEASQQHMHEQQMRFTAPLQHRKQVDENGTILPAIKGAQKKVGSDIAGRDCFGFLGTDKAKWLEAIDRDKKPQAVPGPMQVAAAHRLMMGHSSQKLSIKPPTPPDQIPKARKDGINYGLQYRERLETLKNKPTLSMTQITFGSFG